MLSVSGCTSVLCELKTSKEIKEKLHTYNLNDGFVDCSRRWP